jgi:hypothetical protein
MPAKSSLRARWKRIDRAFHRGENLPPVALCKFSDEYFVADGNHRVSVARFHGVEWIDAEVMYSGVPETRVGQSGARRRPGMIEKNPAPWSPLFTRVRGRGILGTSPV